MNHIASFLLDHNVSRSVSELLRASGHEATTAAILRLERGRDGELLFTAAQRGVILLTHNAKDFELLHDAWRGWSTA